MPEMMNGLKWQVQFCMRSPPSAVPIVATAVVMLRMKILFFVSPTNVTIDYIHRTNVFTIQYQLQITRIPYLPGMEWKDCTSIVLPMVYDVTSNITQLAERRETPGYTPAISTGAVSNMLRRFVDFSSHHGECSIFPAVRDLLMNLTLPNEPQAPPPNQQHQQQLQNQVRLD